jgi:hypothetical protein
METSTWLTDATVGSQHSEQDAKTSSLNSNELALVRMGSGLRFVRIL